MSILALSIMIFTVIASLCVAVVTWHAMNSAGDEMRSFVVHEGMSFDN